MRDLGVILYVSSGVAAAIYLGFKRLQRKRHLRLRNRTTRVVELAYCVLAPAVWLSAHLLIWFG